MEEEIIESPPAVPGPFFRFADETAWLSAARSAGFMSTVTDDEGTETEVLVAYTADRAIDVVGTLYNDDAVFDKDGELTTPATAMAGYHVNYQGALPEGWEAFEVTPENPKRVFA